MTTRQKLQKRTMKKNLSQTRNRAFDFLEECVAKKEKIELDLYQKFVTVLNDKKAKIRQLQHTIEQLTKENNLKKKSYEGENADIAKNEHGTDEKDNEDNVKNKESQQNETMSLFQDTDDQIAPVKKRERRKRSSGVPVKKTPSKSFIPEVKMRVECSNTSDASTASNESLQYNSHKTTRTRNNKVPRSTFTEDIDELFGDMM
ncbi:DNA repair protein XRCC4-like [Xenia sp. Carnegie-2017]|uniref:DNA repair protein XRCC4-like n=1 Tax=Xenia sp. Carnegie-2017 TaxID=2897299 RepID=UPI001F0334A8|nr:DNA repair protein XRCC4-like [Xenia sp. Carnegie-2017]